MIRHVRHILGIAAAVCVLGILSPIHAQQPIIVSVPSDTTVDGGKTFWLPVRVSEIRPEDNVMSFQIAIDYPEDIMAPTGLTDYDIALSDMLNFLEVNIVDGTLLCATHDRIIGSGTLFSVRYKVFGSTGDSTRRPVELVTIDSSAVFNDGVPAATLVGGSVLVSNPGVVSVGDAQPDRAEPRLFASPNPFNAEVLLRLEAPDFGNWRGEIVSVTGQVVRRWEMTGRTNRWTWDARDDNGNAVSSGVYLARLTNGMSHAQTKVTLLR